MNESPRNPDPQPSGSLVRDVALIVLAGVALGLAHNWFMLQEGPGKGLAWIKTERKVVRFEDTIPADPAPVGTLASPVATPAPAATAGTGRDTAAARVKPSATRPAAMPATPVATAPRATAPAATTAPGTAAPPADVPAIPESRDPLESGLAVVRRLYAANAAVFVDARSAGEYAEAHIAGAVNVPFEDVFRDPKRLETFDARGLPVVTYCGGGDCDLSRNLAFSLIDAGKRRVVVFLGGLPEWEQAGLPVNKGGQP